MADDQPPVSEPNAEASSPEPAAPSSAVPETTASEVASASADASLNAAATAEASSETGAATSTAADATDTAAIDELLKQASFEDVAGGGADGSADLAAAGAAPFELPSFQQVMQDAQASSIDLLRDVELNVKIELGRSRMLVEDVLKLVEGSVVELDKLAGDPVDVFVNDRLVARGEVLVLNDNFCVRVNEIVAGLKEEGL